MATVSAAAASARQSVAAAKAAGAAAKAPARPPTAPSLRTAGVEAAAFAQSLSIGLLQSGVGADVGSKSQKASAYDIISGGAGKSKLDIASDAFASLMTNATATSNKLTILQATKSIKAKAAAKQAQAAATKAAATAVTA